MGRRLGLGFSADGVVSELKKAGVIEPFVIPKIKKEKESEFIARPERQFHVVDTIDLTAFEKKEEEMAEVRRKGDMPDYTPSVEPFEQALKAENEKLKKIIGEQNHIINNKDIEIARLKKELKKYINQNF